MNTRLRAWNLSCQRSGSCTPVVSRFLQESRARTDSLQIPTGKSRKPFAWAILLVALLVSTGALDTPLAHSQASSTAIPQLTPGLISTVAGEYYSSAPAFSGDGGPATSAQMWYPTGMALDSQGNLYIADSGNDVIRVVNMQSTAITVLGVSIQPGDIQTVIGTPDSFGFIGDGGPAGQASLALPLGLTFDSQGNLYIADNDNSRIRVVNFQSTAITVFGVVVQPGDIETVAGDLNGTVASNCANETDSLGDGCPATQTAIDMPTSIAFDAAGNLYIVDSDNFVIRKVNASTGIVSLVAGTGTDGFSGDGGSAVQAELFDPNWVQLDAAGNVYIADLGSNRVRVVNTQSAAITLYGVTIQPGTIETVAGSGTAIVNGSSTSTGYSGDGGPANQALLNEPSGIWLDPAGDLSIADSNNDVIRKVNAQSGIITTVAGSTAGEGAYSGDGGSSTAARLNNPYSVLLDPAGDLFIADEQNEVVREVVANALVLNFPNTYPGFVSPAQVVTLQNIGGAEMTISSTSFGGADPSSFGLLDETTCSSSLASGASCTFNIAFEPASSGALTASLNITESTPPASQSIVLNGGGSSTNIAQITVSPTQLSFGNQIVGAVSASQSVTVTNTGTAALSPSAAEVGIVTIVGLNAGDFTETNNCGSSLAAGTICTINVFFAPQAPVRSAAFLVVQGDGENTPVLVPLSGTGTTAAGTTPANSPLLQVIPGTISTIAGDNLPGYTGNGGPAIAAELEFPEGVSADANGDLYVPQVYNQVISFVNQQSTAVSPDGITVQPGDIQTIAGNGLNAGTEFGTYSGDGGLAIDAGLSEPESSLLDHEGNLYFLDGGNEVIRVVNTQPNAITVNGVSIPSYGMQTVAGIAGAGTICANALDSVGDGCPAVDATLNQLAGQIAMDAAGNLYIADTCDQVIRAINMGSSTTTIAGVSIAPGYIQIIAGILNNSVGDCGAGSGTFSGDGGPPLSANLYLPMALAVDAKGNIYIGDSANFRIRAINTQSTTQTILGVSIAPGTIETVAGNGTLGYSGDFGPATAAEIAATSTPRAYSIALDPAGNLYLADYSNNVIREIFASNGIIRTVAGNGYGAINVAAGTYTGGYAGDGGAATSAELYAPNSLVIDAFGNLDIVDGANQVVRQVTPTPAAFNFPDTQVGTTSAPEIYTFSNISTQSISFSGIAISPNFKQVASGLTDCTSTTTLPPAGICQMALAFAPSEVGFVTGTAVITNTAGVQTIALSGTGTAASGTSQTIVVTTAAPASAAYNSTFNVAATASSGLAVAITTSGACSGAGSGTATITMTAGTGSCTVYYNQAGNNTYSAAPQVTNTTTATQASQTITVTTAAPASAADNSTFSVAATAGSGLTVSIAASGACTGSGTGSATVTMTAATGTCTVTYTQAGNSTYAAAPTVTSMTTATAATLTSQTIVVTTAAPASAADNSTFPVAAAASSGLTVSIAASGACTGSGTGSATITMTAATGTCTVTYTQAGNSTYAAAPTVTSMTTATAATLTSQTIVVTTAAPASAADNSTFPVAATASSGLTVSIAASGACTGSGTSSATIVMTAATGTCTVTYTQAGNSTYAAAPTVTSMTTATPATLSGQTITVTTAAPASAADGSTFPVAATASSGLTVSIAASGACTGSGTGSTTITMTAATGTCTVTYSQGGNSTYAAAPNVTSTTTATSGTGAPAPTFKLSSPTGAQSVQPGASAQYTITATAQNGTFSSAVTLAASGLPAGATATFSSASITPGNSSANSTLTIQTAATTAAVTRNGSMWPLAAPALALIGLFFLPGRRYRRWITLALLLASLGTFTALTGCGGGFGTTASTPAATNYNITVTGSSGSEQQSTTVQLTVE